MADNSTITDEHRIATAVERYQLAMHAVQSGVAFEMKMRTDFVEPKHLRVGINSAMVNDEGLATLLIAKGLITLVEYHEAMADAAEREKARAETTLTKMWGRPVTLG